MTRGGNEQFSKELKARIYRWVVRLVKYLRTLTKQTESTIWDVIKQAVDSGTSVGANYVEAIGSPTTKDFRKFLSHSLKSCNETKYWLAVLRDAIVEKADKELDWLIQEAIEISNILGKSVSTMYKDDYE